MALEIERKFLVRDGSWRSQNGEILGIAQAYLSLRPTVRVRVQNDQGFLTVKGPSQGISREEYEYSIPKEQARMMFKLCVTPVLVKDRHVFDAGDGLKWEVDEFYDDNEGLVVAEIELKSDGQDFPRPTWLGEEVTHDKRYSNSNLALVPFKEW